MIYYDGVTESSYGKVASDYNRRVRQRDKTLNRRSIQKGVLLESAKLDAALESQSQAILSSYEASDPDMKEKSDKYEWEWEKKEDLIVAYEQMYESAPEHIQPHLSLEASDYEVKDKTIDITVDDICVKEQKPTGRNRKSTSPSVSVCQNFKSKNCATKKPLPQRKGGKKIYKKKKFSYSTVLHFQSNEGQYGLCRENLKNSIDLINAFLLFNNGLKMNWLFHVDGQRTLHDCLLKHFSWHNSRLLLDWYHLRKKIQRQFFLSLYTSDERDKIMTSLFTYAWYGLVDDAISLINRIKPHNIKNQKDLEVLKGYFERNRDIIPNYDMRHRLGLRNSSNRGEKENDLLIAQRQKHNGMAWSKEGSRQLAKLTAVKRNDEKQHWFEHNKLAFRFLKAAS